MICHRNRVPALAGAICITLFLTAPILGLEVDVDEITSTKKVVFENYSGPSKGGYDDTVKEIRSIGARLARGVQKTGPGIPYRYHMKYSVIHAVSDKADSKYSADIISIDKDARVLHVKNIRRILTGFFQEMYSYSRKNAETLALFTTYYNAIYRSDLDYFGSKYKDVVLRNITAKNAGISTKYYDWPGATKLVIPLTVTAMRGKLNTIDTDIISDDKVIGQIRKDGKHLDERKDMVEMKDKIQKEDKDKLARDKVRLKEEQDKLTKDKQTIQREKEQLDKQKQKTQEQEKQVQREKQETQKIKDDKERKDRERQVQEKEKEVVRDKDKQKKQEETLREKETQTKDKEQKLKEEQKRTEDKDKQVQEKDRKIQEEKQQIQKDETKQDRKVTDQTVEQKAKELEKKEKELDKREDKLRDKELDKSIYAEKLYYLKIRDYLEGGHYNNELYMINASTRKIDFKSPVENICGRRYDIFSGGVVMITHKGSHTAGHHLTLIDRKSLEEKITGTDDIFWRSFVEIHDGFIYAVVKEKEDYFLGKFDDTLKRVAKSNEKINENTFISFYDTYIYINRHDKQIMVLKKEDLSLLDMVKQ